MTRWMTHDRWTAVVCFAIAVFVILAIPSQTSDKPLPGTRGFNVLDGAFFPRIAVALFIIASVWLFFEGRPEAAQTSGGGTGNNEGLPTVAPSTTSADADIDLDDGPQGITLRDLLWALGLTGGLLIYVQLLEPVGYLLSTIVGVSILAYVCGQRSWVGIALGGVVFPAVVFYLFTRLFMVPLPRGPF
jgi:Tripartite tricarboxylate transporter TctB family